MNWDELNRCFTGDVAPETPKEIAAALQQLVALLLDNWDTLPDGDSLNVPPDEGNVTKMDLFTVIKGGCEVARQNLSLTNQINQAFEDMFQQWPCRN